MKTIPIVVITLLSIFLLVGVIGCNPEEATPIVVYDSETKDMELSNKVTALEARVSLLESNQLTSADIIGMINFTLDNQNHIDTSNVTDGCPSEHDINVKWFDALGRGDITQEQYDRILDKYNSEECQ